MTTEANFQYHWYLSHFDQLFSSYAVLSRIFILFRLFCERCRFRRYLKLRPSPPYFSLIGGYLTSTDGILFTLSILEIPKKCRLMLSLKSQVREPLFFGLVNGNMYCFISFKKTYLCIMYEVFILFHKTWHSLTSKV